MTRRLFLPRITLFLAGLGFLLPTMATAAIRSVDLLNAWTVAAPIGVASDTEGRLYVAHKKGGASILGADGQTVATLDGKDDKGKALLASPGGIACGEGRVYVADQNLDRIVVFDRNGAYLDHFGASGDEPKEFDDPQGLALAGGILYVVDHGNDRVQAFSPEGLYLFSLGQSGTDDSRVKGPLQIAVTPQGKLYVLNDDGRVVTFSLTGEPLGGIASRPAVAIAADAEGLFLVDKKTLQIIKIDSQGKELFSFGSKGKDRTQFQSVAALSASAEGRLTVADPNKGTVQIFGTTPPPPLHRFDAPPPPTATLWRQEVAGRYSHLAGQASGLLCGLRSEGKEKALDILQELRVTKTVTFPKWNPVAVAVAGDGTIWVLDAAKSQVLKLNGEGALMQSFGSSGSRDGSFDDPSDLAVSNRGLVYVADTDNRRVQVFNAGGTLLHVLKGGSEPDIFERPTALAVDAQENLYVLDRDKGLVAQISAEGQRTVAFGSRGEAPTQFRDPVDLAVTADEIFVLDADAGCVKIFGLRGDFRRAFGAPGKGKGDLADPAALLALDATTLLLADTGNARLQVVTIAYTPTAPSGLTGSAGPRQVALQWEKNREAAVEAYRVYRKKSDDDDFRLLKETSDNNYLDRDVLPGQTYLYTVTALARAGHESPAAPTREATPLKLTATAPTNFTALPQEWSVDLSWNGGAQAAVAEYRVYRLSDGKRTPLGKTKETTFYDGNLDPDTVYQYAVTSVSIDEVESEAAELKTATLLATRPPIEIEVVSMSDVFSNAYKMYETEGIGKLRITNNTRDQIAKIKVNFTIKDFMDFPSEFEIVNLAPRSSQEIVLKAVFNNLLLNLTEDTPVQGEITAAYYKNQNQTKFSKIQTLRLFEKHRLIWDEPGHFSAFVTPKDPVILEFGRAIASQFSEFGDPILFAGMGFDALGLLGIGYLPDPSNPYQVTSEKTDTVDYLQYPRETLSRKSGDCDDLVALYAAVLESLGIQTKVVAVPGHMFMMFATTLTSEAVPKNFRGMYVENEGILWVPIEVTDVGAPFMKAWEAGIKNYEKWDGKDLTLMDVRSAWKQFKPASLPMTEWKPQQVSREQLAARYADDLSALRKIRLQNLGQPYLTRLQRDPNDAGALLQLGIVYARHEEPREALAPLEKARVLSPSDSSVHNNLANVYSLLERYDEAAASYAEAVRLDGGDPMVWVNYARTLLRLNKKNEAVAAYAKAVALNPEIRSQLKTLDLTLGTPY